ncbi:hypothetical protein L1049_000249 [Liquidambar formosana]|uniref:Uncharacterized protein n=1 Tax=Liquidambar formosana TaxID=63359 RepID=A0AAP0R2I1_LIQFO
MAGLLVLPLKPSLQFDRYRYLTRNLLTGPIPDWMLKDGKYIDLSYNSFTSGNLSSCQQDSVNLFRSSTENNNSTLGGEGIRTKMMLWELEGNKENNHDNPNLYNPQTKSLSSIFADDYIIGKPSSLSNPHKPSHHNLDLHTASNPDLPTTTLINQPTHMKPYSTQSLS